MWRTIFRFKTSPPHHLLLSAFFLPPASALKSRSESRSGRKSQKKKMSISTYSKFTACLLVLTETSQGKQELCVEDCREGKVGSVNCS